MEQIGRNVDACSPGLADEQAAALKQTPSNQPGWRCLVVLTILLFSWSANACEPVFPLIQVFTGTLYLSGITGIAILLPLAVAVKCVAFVRLEKGLRAKDAVWMMIKANLYSSVMGILASFSAVMPIFLFVSLPIIYLASLVPAGRILNYANWAGKTMRMTKKLLAFGFVAAFIATIVLFEIARMHLDERDYAQYWIWKFIYVTVALGLSILMTASWEESMIARLAARKYPEATYFVSVVRANYVTFGLLLLIAAVLILPARFRNAHFLAVP